MAYTPPWQRLCDCRCPLHYRLVRTTYNEDRCGRTITCATQPMTLLADHWGCALFLDEHGDLWYVNALVTGTWDWKGTGEVDGRSDFYDTSVIIQHLLRLSEHVLGKTVA